MESTVTVKAEAGATERSGRARVAEAVSKAALSRLFMARIERETKKQTSKLEQH
jgi:hypothetical protein